MFYINSDCEHFLVIDVVVPLGWIEGFRDEPQG